MTRREKKNWLKLHFYDWPCCEKHAPSPKWITALAGETNWTRVVPRALMCLTVCHIKEEQEKQCSWRLHHVTSLPEWGNRRWHLADSLTLADLLGVGWLLWFWNYSLDELEHFTTKKKIAAEMGQAGAEFPFRGTGRSIRRRRLFTIECIKLTKWMGHNRCLGSDWSLLVYLTRSLQER